jgi:fumarate hydratase class II
MLVGVLFKKVGFFKHAEIQENAIRELRAITESAFQEAFQQWKKRLERCIASRGD